MLALSRDILLRGMATDFTIMTCNIGNGRAKPERLVQVLIASGADVIGIQEVSLEQSEALENRLASEYPHRVMFPGGFAGKVVLSRYPLVHNEQLHLSTVRPDLLVHIQIEERVLTLIVAHPPPPYLTRMGFGFDMQTWHQIRSLARLARENEPSVLLGDFNFAPWSKTYTYMRATGLQDAYTAAGKKSGFTLPKRIGPWKRFLLFHRLITWLPLVPVLRVDYIWYSGELNSVDAWVGEDTGSDHLPVLARLAFEPNENELSSP